MLSVSGLQMFSAMICAAAAAVQPAAEADKRYGRLGIRLLGTTFWCGLSNHQADTAQMHLVEKSIVECPPLLGGALAQRSVADKSGQH